MIRALSAARAALVLSIAVLVVAGAAGCNTEAFCFADCDGKSSSTTTGSGGNGVGGFTGTGGDGGCVFGCGGGGSTTGCEPSNGGIEKCDGVDNDCNGTIDDGPDIDFASAKTCGTCENNCLKKLLNCDPLTITCEPSAKPGIEEGTCKCGKCAQDYFDPDGDGICDYYCIKSSSDDTLCNKKDDDCDGVKDEDVDVCTSTTDCGKCGNNCVVLHGSAKCENDGGMPCSSANTQCMIDDCDCTGPGDCFWDNDNSYATGCEYKCDVTNGGVELCDGLDNDCDGKIDAADDLAQDPLVGAVCHGDPDGECATAAHDGTTECQGGQIVCVGPNLLVEQQVLETCNGLDDDCDGVVDNSPTDVGNACGVSNIAPCAFGVTKCQNAAIVCFQNLDPVMETCNGIDDDCDGTIDDGAMGVGVSCGVTDTGPCQKGTIQCVGGSLQCVGEIAPQTETCNNVDDDCDGMTDDNVVGAGAQCGQSGTPPCSFGAMQCQNGQMVCMGAVNPVAETCNNVDDDCDGMTDDNPTDAGASCGQSNVFPCAFGSMQCQNGALVCMGALNPKTELCNGIDDDCDGQIDKTGGMPPSDSVGPCQVPIPPPAGATSPCMAGSKACTAGVVQCVGAVGPTGPTDTCGVDANCDGTLTNQPNLQTDVANCGMCGNSCYAGSVHAIWACVAGGCQFQSCQPGYYDLNGDNKCEYACTFVSATEACNGVDDNCNGTIDEGVVKPSPVQVCGVSPSALTPECTSQVQVNCVSGAWACTFPANVCPGGCSNNDELCDTLDNDCDGILNENVPNFGKPCASDDGLPPPGDGACRTTGTIICNGPNASTCSAVKANCAGLPGGCTELCDGIDNDCDGVVDETFNNKGSNTTNFVKPVVTKVLANTWIYTYEASRPKATNVVPGSGNGFWTSAPVGVTLDKTPSCSVATKIPWFNVTPQEVEQVCTAMGGAVCSTANWQTACQATIPCTWGYNPRGAQCGSAFTASKFCNLGPSFDFDGATAGDQDGLLPTASASLGNCWADWSGLQGNSAATNKLFDVTGNLREITKQANNDYRLMGGAFNTASDAGATCSFTFYSVVQTYQFFDTGFRCCFTADPTL